MIRGVAILICLTAGSLSWAAEPSPPLPRAMGEEASASLQLPAWLLPEDDFGDDVVIASDQPSPAEKHLPVAPQPLPSFDAPITLVSAQFDLGNRRLRETLVQAEQLASRAHSVGDVNDLVELCEGTFADLRAGGKAASSASDQPAVDALRQLSGWAYNRRGELQTSLGNPREAFDDFQRAIVLDKQCWAALHNRGVTLAQHGKRDQALADFNGAIALNPKFATAYGNRAELLAAMGHWRQAVSDYTTLLKLSPADSPAVATTLTARAIALQQLRQVESAVRDLNEAVRLAPQDAVALATRGNVYAEVGFFDQALADWQKSLQLDPQAAATYRSVAWLLATCSEAKFRNATQAIEAARRAQLLSGTPNDPAILDTLATAHASAGEFDQAVRYAQQAVLLAAPKQKADTRSRLERFRNRLPYRETVRVAIR